jgi:hypothetical protein
MTNTAPPPETPPLLETPWAQHICGFAHTIAHAVNYLEDGTLHYAFGHGFNALAKLDTPEALARFGIQKVWFSRYFKRGACLPTLRPNETRTLPTSQIQLGVRLRDGVLEWSEQHQQALRDHLFATLPVSPEEVDSLQLKTDKTCCHSPCFGCTVFDVQQAIHVQGRTPWLAVLEAQTQELLGT